MEYPANEITVTIKSIGEILDNANLHIPDYQRPYKWERRHIRNLFYDICEAIEKSPQISEYRIGSIILHNNNAFTDIVDGQQRLISLSLFFYTIKKMLGGKLYIGADKIIGSQFTKISREHARENLNEWEVLCNSVELGKLKEITNYMKNKCKVSIIEMPQNRLAEAFQLFDSQNNRGKALEPHDLLKAYHLRAIKNPTENTIKKWEEFVNNKELSLKKLFDKHLFRIRRWANGNTGLYKRKHSNELRFSEHFINDFKGVNLDSGNYPYLELYKSLKNNNIDFPDSLCMPIIDGEHFFKFIEYCHRLFAYIVN